MFRNASGNRVDFATRAQAVWEQTGDAEETKKIIGLELQSYGDRLKPEIAQKQKEAEGKRLQAGALVAQLYQRPIPVKDTSMIRLGRVLLFLWIVFAFGLCVALVGNAGTVYAFGFAIPLALLASAVLTVGVVVAGVIAFERLLHARPWLQTAIGLVSCVLVLWGLLQLVEARGAVMGTALTASSESFVDSPYIEEMTPPDDQQADRQSLQEQVVELIEGANVKIAIAADLAVALLFALIAGIRHDEDYSSWCTLQRLPQTVIGLERQVEELFADFESQKKLALASILLCRHFEKKPPPFLRVLPVIVALVVLPSTAMAQATTRREVILLDVSRSADLFPEYMRCVRQMLQTTPPNSRLSLMMIASDSFGGADTVLRGWTPDARGVFTDGLARARQQLVREFDTRAKGIKPVAESTDIFGAIWKVHATFSSDSSKGPSREIVIFSDMVNAARGLSIAEMIAAGPHKVLESAKAKGLVAPLDGYRIFVYGASTSGMSPAAYQAIRTFWTLYFKAAGADLVRYSPEVPNGREQ